MGRHEGMAVFVPDTAAGDVIKCRIVKVLKSYAFGIAEEIITPSPHRLDRGCKIKRQCGGCIFRHISYEEELRIKESSVLNAFLRLGGFKEGEFEFLPALGCDETDHYRNKAQFPVTMDKDGRAVCGFYARRSHRVVPCTDCLLQPSIFGDILRFVMKFVNDNNITPYDEVTDKGLLRHIYIRRGTHSGEIMVCFVARKRAAHSFMPLAEALGKNFPDVRSVVLNVNGKRTNVIMGEENVTLFGADHIKDIMCGNEISISPLSFYQVNTVQAERLYAIAGELAALSGNEDVLDLYCGAGTIGLSLAKKAGHITGAEIIPAAVENARANAAANGISNADFICADAGMAASHFAELGRRPHVIITDPPRKGCDELTLSSMVKMSPERIVMVSCNPATAARDCRYLQDNGYRLVSLRAVDMFPGTGHCEAIALMIKK